MDQGIIIQLFRDAIYTMVIVVSPILLIAMLVGILIALFQATTQINEQTMVFVPKVLAVFIGILLLGAWMLSTLGEYTIQLFESILTYV
jgi:flagellar biosynthetic protein FliQ